MNPLKMYDDLPAEKAVIEAWLNPGKNVGYHEMTKNSIRKLNPILGRALDRLARENN